MGATPFFLMSAKRGEGGVSRSDMEKTAGDGKKGKLRPKGKLKKVAG